jgi:lipopolysaccharide transport protein LptA
MMKHLLLILAAAIATAAYAQTNSIPTSTNSAPSVEAAPASTNSSLAASPSTRDETPIEILSDRAQFNLKTRVGIYSGNVRVNDPQLKLTCDHLTVALPQSRGRLESIVALGNVVVDAEDRGNQIHATCEKLVFANEVVNGSTNEVIRLTGNPIIQRQGDNRIQGEEIVLNLTTGVMDLVGAGKTELQLDTLSGTNRGRFFPGPSASQP